MNMKVKLAGALLGTLLLSSSVFASEGADTTVKDMPTHMKKHVKQTKKHVKKDVKKAKKHAKKHAKKAAASEMGAEK